MAPPTLSSWQFLQQKTRKLIYSKSLASKEYTPFRVYRQPIQVSILSLSSRYSSVFLPIQNLRLREILLLYSLYKLLLKEQKRRYSEIIATIILMANIQSLITRRYGNGLETPIPHIPTPTSSRWIRKRPYSSSSARLHKAQ